MPIQLNDDLRALIAAQLGQCPCGEDAVWYRADPTAATGDIGATRTRRRSGCAG